MTSCTDHDKAVLNRLFNPNLPYDDTSDNQQQNETVEEESESEKEIKQLEVEGVKKAESGDIQGAIELFTEAIKIDPSRPSGYNNRAQALRLKADIDGALEDLDKAVELSNGEGKAACQAYTQRALIKRLRGNEDEALEDFKKAAKLGSEFAKHMVVAANPYAALCNQMLTDVITKLKSGQEI